MGGGRAGKIMNISIQGACGSPCGVGRPGGAGTQGRGPVGWGWERLYLCQDGAMCSAAAARALLLLLLAAAASTAASSPAPVPPSPRDADWLAPFRRADLLYHPGPRPDFAALRPIENCTVGGSVNCSALWWPGLGNGFLGGIAQGPTLRIAGLYSGFYASSPWGVPTPSDGFSGKEFAYRASIPAFASSITPSGPALLVGTTR